MDKKNKQLEYQPYVDVKKDVRYRTVTYTDPEYGKQVTDYCFEVFTRPYFFNMLGKKKWIGTIQTNCFSIGLGFTLTCVKK